MSGLAAFACVIFAEPLAATLLFRIGATAIGFGAGLFSVGTLTAAMNLENDGLNGLALGAWGAVQATCAGVAIAAGGALRDIVSSLATRGALGSALAHPAVGYSFVYHLELYLLFATLIAIGPLVRSARVAPSARPRPASTGRSEPAPALHRQPLAHSHRSQSWEPEPSPPTSTSRRSRSTPSGFFSRA